MLLFNRFPLLLVSFLSLAWCQPALTTPVLERIAETGVIRAGAREDAIPFGYLNSQGEWVGYSLDILELIRRQVETKLGKPIKLELVRVTPENRFSYLEAGTIDIECGSTTFTWEREQTVDFSLSYFASGTQLLVKTEQAEALSTIPSLVGKRLGIIPETTNGDLLRDLQPEANFIEVKDRYDGLRQLAEGEIDGLVSDGIVLQGLRLSSDNPQAYGIVPDYPYLLEAYACILPQDQSQWRDLVNYTLAQFMEGVVSDEQQSVAIYDRWFGEEGVVPYSREIINDYFLGTLDTLEWIPLPVRY